MNRTAKYLTKKFGSPVIGDSMILYKAVIQNGKKLYSDWDRGFEYVIGKEATPLWEVAAAHHGTCASGVHVGSMAFAKQFGAGFYCEGREKVVILACQVRVADMVVADINDKVRCRKILPLGIVRE